jgi:hypothetical protein
MDIMAVRIVAAEAEPVVLIKQALETIRYGISNHIGGDPGPHSLVVGLPTSTHWQPERFGEVRLVVGLGPCPAQRPDNAHYGLIVGAVPGALDLDLSVTQAVPGAADDGHVVVVKLGPLMTGMVVQSPVSPGGVHTHHLVKTGSPDHTAEQDSRRRGHLILGSWPGQFPTGSRPGVGSR